MKIVRIIGVSRTSRFSDKTPLVTGCMLLSLALVTCYFSYDERFI